MKTIQRVIESGDETIQVNLNNDIILYPQLFFINTFKTAVTQQINLKFTQAYKGLPKRDLGQIIKNSEFVIQDMVRALKYIQPGFY